MTLNEIKTHHTLHSSSNVITLTHLYQLNWVAHSKSGTNASHVISHMYSKWNLKPIKFFEKLNDSILHVSHKTVGMIRQI